MTKIINLRQVRKQREREARRAQADTNAARFGEAKPLRDSRQGEMVRAQRALDAHRRGDDPDHD